MKAIKAIKTIVFDLGGVLLDLDLDACTEAFRKLGYPEDEKPVDPYLQTGVFMRLEEGLASAEEYYAYVNGKLPKPVSNEAIKEALSRFALDIPDYKLTMLLDLRKRGYRIFMLSNTNPIMFDFISDHKFTVQGLTVNDYFDRLYLSYRMKTAKPSARIFEMMIADSDIDLSQTLFIDDGQANIDTAAKLGFETYHAAAGEDFRHIFDSCKLAE